MQKFRKLRYVIFSLVICAFMFGGCSLFGGPRTLQTPIAGMDRQNQELTWYTVPKADEYVIYLNGSELTRVNNNRNLQEQVYDFSDDLTTYGKYKFKLKAIADGYSDSAFSAEVIYSYANTNLELTNDEYNMIYGDTVKSPKNVELNGNVVSWSNVANAEKYIVTTLYSGSGVRNYVVDKSINVFNMIGVADEKEIVAYKVGAKFEGSDDVYYLNKLPNFYNPKNSGEYTQDIYLFDGYIADHYIETIEELENVIYYHFIERDEEYRIRLTEECVVEIGELFRVSGAYTQQAPASNSQILETINNSFDSFLETCHYDLGEYGTNYASRISSIAYDYALSIDFFGVTECETNLYSSDYGVEQYAQFEIDNPYYESFESSIPARDENYDDFVSDDYFLADVVSTSEELYWAVENKVTPLPKAGSRADIIYREAKNVLREIIKDDMTDYEKALSIFDWIAVNTNYDNANVASIFREDPTAYYTRFCAYYLEGVFIQKIAVCDGYSKAYSLMCNMEGIDCIRITGEAGGGLHAWNKVRIDENYYIVDITWTESRVDLEQEEYLTHEYFLVADKFIENSHYPWSRRTKFGYYSTPLENYNYYAKTLVSFKNVDGETVTEDLIVENDEELSNLMYYYLTTGVQSTELVFKESYVNSLRLKGGYPSTTLGVRDSILMEGLKKQKFAMQMLSAVCDGTYFLYDNHSNGCLLYISFKLLNDASGELKLLADYFTSYSEIDDSVLEKEFEVYIDENLFNHLNGEDVQTKAENYLNSENVGIYFDIEYLNESEVMNFGSDILTHKFKLTFKEGLKILNAPEIELNMEENVISFNEISGAKNYELYLDGELYKTLPAISNTEVYEIDLDEEVAEGGVYEIYLVAVSNVENVISSPISNKVEAAVLVGTLSVLGANMNLIYNNAQISSPNIKQGKTLNTYLSWNKIGGVLDYILAVSTENGEISYYKTTDNVVDLSAIAEEVVAVKVGARYPENENAVYILNLETFYISGVEQEYSLSYTFDGELNDHYIESEAELNNVIYYNFIQRTENYRIKLSPNFLSLIDAKYEAGANLGEKGVLAIEKAFGSFCETSHFDVNLYSPSMAKCLSSDYSEYGISLTFFGVKEANLGIDNSSYTYNQATYYTAFYDKYESTVDARNEDHVYFSDTYYLTTNVSTSEELYWAVENKITPIVKPGSRAEAVYNEAKAVLNEIIKDDMTDYQKALAIFEWICLNTVYDYSDAETQFKYYGVYYTENPAYYLEGVFLTGIAVCDGYSKAYSLMCNMEGIDCIRIVGSVTSGASMGLHAWNKVLINEKYYAVDITWTEIMAGDAEVLSHKYFMIADSSFPAGREDWAARDKFKEYPAEEDFKYYENTTHTYINEAGETKTLNLVADNDESMKKILDYGIFTQTKSMDFVLDRMYKEACIEALEIKNNITYQDGDWMSAICLYWKELKFISGFLTINFDDERVIYKENKTGYIINFEYRILVDEHIEIENEEEVETFELQKITEAFENIAKVDSGVYNKEIEIFIEQEFLSGVSEGENVQGMLDAYLETLELEERISLTYEEKEETFFLNGVFVPCYSVMFKLLNSNN